MSNMMQVEKQGFIMPKNPHFFN